MYHSETANGTNISSGSYYFPTPTPTDDQLRKQEVNEALNEAYKLTKLLKTPNLTIENIDLINLLISETLFSLIDCDCEDEDSVDIKDNDIDFKDKTLEEMFDLADEIGF